MGGVKRGFEFEFYQCERCLFSFVGNPWTEFDEIYSKEYYEGRGADPRIDYWFELEHPNETIRHYEWSGLLQIANALIPTTKRFEWLDFGCGNGGLVRYVNGTDRARCVGYEEGYIVAAARSRGIPIIGHADLNNLKGRFDLVTAIEVIEHVPDPIAFLSTVRSMLRKGGILLVTTGNATSHRGRIHKWSYASIPEIHVSFFEPETLACAMRQTAFTPVNLRFVSGFEQVIKFKILKNIGVKKRSAFLDVLPWSLISRMVDLRFGVTKHPIGIAV